jgi:hypothetical protein
MYDAPAHPDDLIFEEVGASRARPLSPRLPDAQALELAHMDVAEANHVVSVGRWARTAVIGWSRGGTFGQPSGSSFVDDGHPVPPVPSQGLDVQGKDGR